MHKKLLLILLSGVIFTIPSNLFLKFFESNGYANGIFVDYLLPKFYLSDTFILLFIVAGSWKLKKPSKQSCALFVKKNALLLGLCFILMLRQFFVTSPLAAWWHTWKLAEMALFCAMLWHQRELLKKPVIIAAIICTILFQSLLALYQYRTQHSLAGYWLLGEPILPQTFGLATQTVKGVEWIAPYGTTAHPNILAGVVVIFLLILEKSLHGKSLKLQLIKLLISSIGLWAIFLSGSVSAWLTLLLGTTLLTLRKRFTGKLMLYGASIGFILIPLIIFFTPLDTPSITRRNALAQQAIHITSSYPLVGIGLNQFTTFPKFSTRELVRFVQPVHHAGLLWLAETGLVGALILLVAVKKTSLKKVALPILLLMPIAALDHYLLTQQSGLLLAVITLIYFAE